MFLYEGEAEKRKRGVVMAFVHREGRKRLCCLYWREVNVNERVTYTLSRVTQQVMYFKDKMDESVRVLVHRGERKILCFQ